MVALLLRYYHYDDGEISINGNELKTLQLKNMRSQIGFVIKKKKQRERQREEGERDFSFCFGRCGDNLICGCVVVVSIGATRTAIVQYFDP